MGNDSFPCDWDAALDHLRLLKHAGIGVTKIGAFRTKPDEGVRYFGVFDPERYEEAIDQMKRLKEANPTFSFFVVPNPLKKSALHFANNKFKRAYKHPTELAAYINVVFDFDPEQERNQLKDADRDGVRQAVIVFQKSEPLLKGVSILNSGHGMYCLVHLPPGGMTREAIKAVHTAIKERFNHGLGRGAKAKIDTLDLSRHMGLAGTWNTKFDESIWRLRKLEARGSECRAFAKEVLACRPQEPTHSSLPIKLGTLVSKDRDFAMWCSGYRDLLKRSPPKGKRSDAAFQLALKMDRDGWEWSAIEGILQSWGKQVFPDDPQKIERILKELPERLKDDKHKMVTPSHKAVREILGWVSCTGNCDVDVALNAKRGNSLVERPMNERRRSRLPTSGPALSHAREALTEHFKDGLKTILLGKEKMVLLSAGPPGIGKTHRMLRLCGVLPCAVFTPRVDVLEMIKADLSAGLSPDEQADTKELLASLGIEPTGTKPEIVLIEARRRACEDPRKQKKVNRLEGKGLAHLVGSRVCATCPKNEKSSQPCRYYRQFDLKPNTTIVAATSWFRTSRIDELTKNAKLVVLDEDPIEYAFDEAKTSSESLYESLVFIQGYLGSFAGKLKPIFKKLLKQSKLKTIKYFESISSKNKALQVDLQGLDRAIKEAISNLSSRQIPTAPIGDIVRAIRKQKGHQLLVGKDRVIWRKTLPIKLEKPIVVLDATGDKRLYKPLFPKHRVLLQRESAKMEAEVWQISDQALPKSSLGSAKIQQIKDIIVAITKDREMQGRNGIGVIGRDDVIEELKLGPGILTDHYWGIRGSRAFERCHTLILVGSAEPGFEDVGFRADLHFGKRLSRERKEIPYRYYLESSPGKSWATNLTMYTDLNLRAFYRRLREGEMVQAAFRIRPLEGSHKRIIILSKIPLRNLPPSDLMTVSALETRLGLKDPPNAAVEKMLKDNFIREHGRAPTQRELAGLMGITPRALRKRGNGR